MPVCIIRMERGLVLGLGQLFPPYLRIGYRNWEELVNILLSWPAEDIKHAKTTSLPPPTFHCPHGFSYRALEISSLVCGSSLSAFAQYRSANKPCNAVMARTGSLCSLNRTYSPLRFLTSSKENLAFEG